MNKRELLSFQKIILDFYKSNKRDLLWRPKKGRRVSPYEILVSEYMLQQTQVDRVIPKYLAFIKKFPNFKTLARASEKEVLLLWSGLGYNRRALYLKKTAEIILQKYEGIIPRDSQVLRTLPGVGEYMSKILSVFVYNKKEVLIETNIRTVYLYHFFKNKNQVTDREVLSVIEKSLPEKNMCDWYYALMDYGSYLKKEKKVKNINSAQYIKQKPFKGSLRYVRGTILKHVLKNKIQKTKIYELFPDYSPIEVDQVCKSLIKEGIVKEDKKYFFI